MAEIYVEENPVRIDADDMKAVIGALEQRLALDAEPTAARGRDTGPFWALALHWTQQGPLPDDAAAALPGAVLQIKEHFTAAGRIQPTRAVLYGPDGPVLWSYEPDPEAV